MDTSTLRQAPRGLNEFMLRGPASLQKETLVHGQILSDAPPHASFADEVVHTFSRTQDNQVVELKFSDLSKNSSGQAKLATRTLGSQVSDKQEQLGEVRTRELKSGVAADLGRAIPKDASFHPTSYLMYADREEAVSTHYAQRMADVGRVEGFNVEVMTPLNDAKRMLKEFPMSNVTVTPTSANAETWSEDYGERTFNGAVIVPVYLADHAIIDQSIYPDRIQRLYGKEAPAGLSTDAMSRLISKKYPLAQFSIHGQVSGQNYQEMLIGAAQSHQWKSRECFSHMEGGNMLNGTLSNGQGYALVGKDSVAVSREKLSQDLGRKVSEAETLQLIAQDLGVKPENVHAIEQPGEFHVDMRMMAAAPGQIILNDAREAYKIQSGWLRGDHRKARPEAGAPGMKKWEKQGRVLDQQLAAMKAEAQQRAKWEDLTAADLAKTGLRVDRMAAVFIDPTDTQRDIANFVNGRGGINAQGERFMIGLGAEERMEAYAAKQLLQTLPTGFNRIHFLDKTLTPQTLDLAGGIKCRTKPMGTEASLKELVTPYPSQLYAVKQA